MAAAQHRSASQAAASHVAATDAEVLALRPAAERAARTLAQGNVHGQTRARTLDEQNDRTTRGIRAKDRLHGFAPAMQVILP